MADLKVPHDMTLETLLWEQPDEPLPDVNRFDQLENLIGAEDTNRLAAWVMQQDTCNTILRYHGDAGLAKVLAGIARACAKYNVHMNERVASAAGWYGIPVC